ncbi:MAG: tRNA-dihydrouridine synthase family protein [Burkholderiales bacterium]|nr:tRNA-dihydrouridine synthase family protein [Burkholderiales bacterium]
MLLVSVAPMEGLTTHIFRRIHAEIFGGADSYFIPFVTPTTGGTFTPRQLRELEPTVNEGLNVVPQLLTARSKDFIWAAKDLASMGYKEVNFNLGCPAGTVVAKGKGAGFLRDLPKLEKFLNEIFDADLPIQISLKMRIGWSDTKEAESIAEVVSKFPFSLVIIHPRLKIDQYRGKAREDVFKAIYPMFAQPIGFNGDIASTQDITMKALAYPSLRMVMAGRGLVSDPALFRKYKGGNPVSKDELKDFVQRLMASYATAFGSQKNALMRMKEHWFYLLNLFEPTPSLFKKVFRCRDVRDYENCISEIFKMCPLLPNARTSWMKPANTT